MRGERAPLRDDHYLHVSTVIYLYEEFKLKNRYIHLYQFEIFAIKVAKNKENNTKICHIFHHNFKNIPCYVMSEASLKRFYFALFDDGLTLTHWRLSVFEFKLFVYISIYIPRRIAVIVCNVITVTVVLKVHQHLKSTHLPDMRKRTNSSETMILSNGI